ncbi:MAG: SUF system Fe-S cluster assembly regulator [Deltaproteobacteria bacterium RIFOXYA12_FULL_58_15]|nr:MAG: SUF system Fe-S cluster assembly regulator [Deltaproteobacteria bacterium RIFOXYA12_FULL_58_15]
MLRLSKLADYAMVLILQAGQEGPRIHTARSLAHMCRLPLPTANKVLKKLTRAGLMLSVRGSSGGYALTRALDEIPVVEVLTAINGQPALTECTELNANGCDREATCPTRAHWHVINATVMDALGGLSVADLARSPNLLKTSMRTRQAGFVPLFGRSERNP